jgi:Tfp pilus assembly protein PilN
MRPVNLIPAEDRRGEQAPLRTGPLAYIVLGALVALLVGVAALVLTDNQISERKGEITQLESEDAAAQARAQRLAPYAQFASLTEQRIATVTSLGDSRFDWERVMRELSLVLPDDVWLVGLTASATPNASVGSDSGGGGSGANGLRGAVPGPALEMDGCAAGQESVAGFVTALKDIDGVTRVGVQSSELSEQESSATAATGSGDAAAGGSNEDCRTRDFIAKFSLVVAFDAAPIPVSGSAIEAAPAVAAEPAPEATTTASETSGEGE